MKLAEKLQLEAERAAAKLADERCERKMRHLRQAIMQGGVQANKCAMYSDPKRDEAIQALSAFLDFTKARPDVAEAIYDDIMSRITQAYEITMGDR